MKSKPNSDDYHTNRIDQLCHAQLIYQHLQFFSNPGIYDVNATVTAPILHGDPSLKWVMLSIMNMGESDYTRQQDVTECLISLIPKLPNQLNFLQFQQKEQTKCRSCNEGQTKRYNSYMAIITINESPDNTFCGKTDIEKYFSNTQTLERNCTQCLDTVGTLKTTIEIPSELLIVCFNLFRRDLTKITAECIPFSNVKITTNQGIIFYKVIGSIEHIGTQIQNGHYVAYLLKDDTWFCCNDLTIEQINNTSTAIRKSYTVLLKKLQETEI